MTQYQTPKPLAGVLPANTQLEIPPFMLNMLFIEDDEVDREATARLLNTLDIDLSIDVASTPQEAADMLDENAYDVILSDYRLPSMDGVDFLSSHVPNEKPPFVASILLTGRGDEDVAVRAMKSGVMEYLQKSDLTNLTLLKAILSADARRKELEIEHHKLNTLRGFAKTIAHDMRSPVATARSYIEFVMTQGMADPKSKEFLDQALFSCDYALLLVNSVYAFADAGQNLGELDTCRLSVLTENVERVLTTEIAAKSAVLSVEHDVEFQCNESALMQVLQNLISNAIKYSSDEPTVTVSGIRKATGVELSIADNGPGIPEEHLKSIFEPMERAGRKEKGGLGFGLATCAAIIEAHGGEIWCESELGKGSTFCIELPDDPALHGHYDAGTSTTRQ